MFSMLSRFSMPMMSPMQGQMRHLMQQMEQQQVAAMHNLQMQMQQQQYQQQQQMQFGGLFPQSPQEPMAYGGYNPQIGGPQPYSMPFGSHHPQNWQQQQASFFGNSNPWGTNPSAWGQGYQSSMPHQQQGDWGQAGSAPSSVCGSECGCSVMDFEPDYEPRTEYQASGLQQPARSQSAPPLTAFRDSSLSGNTQVSSGGNTNLPPWVNPNSHRSGSPIPPPSWGGELYSVRVRGTSAQGNGTALSPDVAQTGNLASSRSSSTQPPASSSFMASLSSGLSRVTGRLRSAFTPKTAAPEPARSSTPQPQTCAACSASGPQPMPQPVWGDGYSSLYQATAYPQYPQFPVFGGYQPPMYQPQPMLSSSSMLRMQRSQMITGIQQQQQQQMQQMQQIQMQMQEQIQLSQANAYRLQQQAQEQGQGHLDGLQARVQQAAQPEPQQSSQARAQSPQYMRQTYL